LQKEFLTFADLDSSKLQKAIADTSQKNYPVTMTSRIQGVMEVANNDPDP